MPVAPPRLYGRKKARKLRPRRAELLATLLPRLRVSVEGGVCAPLALFDAAPRAVWLEVGFGAGEHLVYQAHRHPDIGVIGCEAYLPATAALLSKLDATPLPNVRLYDGDARVLLAALAPASLARVFVLFPDPWPKRRHRARRFMQPETLRLISRALLPGGELRLASDDPVCIAWSLMHLLRAPDLVWRAAAAADWRRFPDNPPPTRYETKAASAGRPPVCLRFVKARREACA